MKRRSIEKLRGWVRREVEQTIGAKVDARLDEMRRAAWRLPDETEADFIARLRKGIAQGGPKP